MQDPNTLSLDALYESLSATGLVTRLLQLARDEDLSTIGDITSAAIIPEAATTTAHVVAREPMVVAGLRAIPELLRVFGSGIVMTLHAEDGRRVGPSAIVATLTGPTRRMLTVERTLLNLLSRLSGVATNTARYVDAVAGTRAVVLDTRKTTPGLRALEKYAVRCGGGHMHRMGLYDAVLIKDNHIAAIPLADLAGALTDATARCKAIAASRADSCAESGVAGSAPAFIEVEVDSLDQLRVILDAGGCGVGIVLLDNMNNAQLSDAVRLRDSARSPILLEASGGIGLDRIAAVAATGVDRISVGALTRSALSVDLGLDIDAG